MTSTFKTQQTDRVGRSNRSRTNTVADCAATRQFAGGSTET